MEYTFYITADFLPCKHCCGKLTFKINQCRWNHFFNLSLSYLRGTLPCHFPIEGEETFVAPQEKSTLYLLWRDPVPSHANWQALLLTHLPVLLMKSSSQLCTQGFPCTESAYLLRFISATLVLTLEVSEPQIDYILWYTSRLCVFFFFLFAEPFIKNASPVR